MTPLKIQMTNTDANNVSAGARLVTEVIESGARLLIEHTQRVAATAKPFKGVPPRLTASSLVQTLVSLGLTVPTKLSAAAVQADAATSESGRRQAMLAGGYKFTLKEVDTALSSANVPIGDRFRLKEAMSTNLILGS